MPKEIRMKEFEIDVKRFYVPAIIKSNCPKCGEEIVNDYNEQYLSYPTANKIMETHFYCDECDEEFYINTLLKVTLEKV